MTEERVVAGPGAECGLLHISVTQDLVLCPAQLRRRHTAAVRSGE